MSIIVKETFGPIYEKGYSCDGPNHEIVGNKVNSDLMAEGCGGIDVSGGYASPIDMLQFHFCDLQCLIDWASLPVEFRNQWHKNEVPM